MFGAAMGLVALAGAAAAADGAGWDWRQSLTPHFVIKHQAARLPPGFSMAVERVHFRLRMDLGMFSPDMPKERVNLFVYADQASYVAGEFRPPRWSNGLAVYESRAVVLPSMKDSRKLLSVMAHETAHLFFDGYWREKNRQPPAWINEGLAMLQEGESANKPETSVWYQRMSAADPKAMPRLESFFSITPTKDLHDGQDAVGDWYVQAYAVTHFLLRAHSRLQFKSFCGHLRDGRPLAEALWAAYRYRTVDELDKKWRAWLADPLHRRLVAALSEEERRGMDEGVVEKIGLRKPAFKAFSSGFSGRPLKGRREGP